MSGTAPNDLYIAEFVVLDANIVANREKVEGYLAYKYGLQANLPVGHAYANVPPFLNVIINVSIPVTGIPMTASLGSFIAPTFIGSQTAQATFLTPPTHTVGSLFLAYAMATNGTSLPALPSGWTNIDSSTGPGDISARLCYKFATTASETVTGFTGCQLLALAVYRTGTTVFSLGVGNSSVNFLSNTDHVTWGGITLLSSAGGSRIVLFGATRAFDSPLEQNSGGFLQRAVRNGTVDSEIVIKDSVGGVTAFAGSQSLSGGALRNTVGHALELTFAGMFVKTSSTFNVTGNSLGISVGTVTVSAVATGTSVNVTGNLMTASVGTVTFTMGTGVSINATGNSMTASTGTATVNAGASVSVNITGNSLTIFAGTVGVNAGGSISTSVAGMAMTASTGTVTFRYDFKVFATGQEMLAETGIVSAGGAAIFSVNGLGMAISVGDVIALAPYYVPVDGVEMTASVGDIDDILLGYSVFVTGVEMEAQLGIAHSANWSNELPSPPDWWEPPTSGAGEGWTKPTRQPNIWTQV